MSAAPEQGQDLVAVACVVEGSFVLASEWPRVLTEYITPLLKRLHDLHHNHQVIWFATAPIVSCSPPNSFD